MGTSSAGAPAGRQTIPLDPRTKIYMAVIVCSAALGSTYEGIGLPIRIAALILPFALLLINKQVKTVCSWALIYLFALNIGQLTGFSKTADVILRLFASMIITFMPCFAMAGWVISSTKVSEFIAAMERLHISQKIVIPFTVMFRFFPTIAEEYRSIRDAMRMRQVGIKNGPVAMLEYRIVPLMISIVKIGDELSAAALTRGLGSKIKRTNACQVGFGLFDLLFGGIATLILIAWLVF